MVMVSRAEYTTLMSAPLALSFSKEEKLPGTISMSPKVAIIAVFSRLENSTILFMSDCDVTHTGHPGPDMSFRFFGILPLIPYFEMEWVCVPHISIIVASFFEIASISLKSALAGSFSRNSSMYFTFPYPQNHQKVLLPQAPLFHLPSVWRTPRELSHNLRPRHPQGEKG